MKIFLGFFTPSLGSGTKTSPKGPGGMKFIGTNALTSLGELSCGDILWFIIVVWGCVCVSVCGADVWCWNKKKSFFISWCFCWTSSGYGLLIKFYFMFWLSCGDKIFYDCCMGLCVCVCGGLWSLYFPIEYPSVILQLHMLI